MIVSKEIPKRALNIQNKMKRIKRTIFSLSTSEKIGSLAILIIVWQVVASFKIGGLEDFPTPMNVLSAFVAYAQTGNSVADITTSMARIAVGFVLGVITGVPLGLFLGWKRALKDWVFPTFEILRPIPPLAWIPLAVIIFATVEQSIYFIIWTGAFFPIVLNTMLGVTTIPQHFKRSSLSLGVNERQMLRHVVIPAAMPSILTGMTLGMGITWNQLVAAEMLAGGSGIGYQLWYFYINENFSNVIMFMIIIGAIGYLFSITIRLIGSRYLKWTMQVS